MEKIIMEPREGKKGRGIRQCGRCHKFLEVVDNVPVGSVNTAFCPACQEEAKAEIEKYKKENPR